MVGGMAVGCWGEERRGVGVIMKGHPMPWGGRGRFLQVMQMHASLLWFVLCLEVLVAVDLSLYARLNVGTARLLFRMT